MRAVLDYRLEVQVCSRKEIGRDFQVNTDVRKRALAYKGLSVTACSSSALEAQDEAEAVQLNQHHCMAPEVAYFRPEYSTKATGTYRSEESCKENLYKKMTVQSTLDLLRIASSAVCRIHLIFLVQVVVMESAATVAWG
jgi:hypothetical protein